MTLTENGSGHTNVILSADENSGQYPIPEGFEIAAITILYVRPGTDECFTVKQEVTK